jgi:tetratricopeptide (TPR) repeat protein
VLAVLLLAHGSEDTFAQSTPRLPPLLDLYERGEYDAALAPIGPWPNSERLLEKLRDDAPRWVDATGPEAAPRRRLIAASFALEAAHRGLANWDDARHLVEWGCQLLRAGPPLPAERTWQLASVALIQGASDVIFLTGLPRNARDPHPSRGTAIDHLTHAELRFPDEARLRLARAVVQEFRSWGQDSKNPRLARGETPTLDMGGGGSFDRRQFFVISDVPDIRFDRETAQAIVTRRMRGVGGVRDLVAARKSLQLWNLIDLFEPFLADETTRADAHVRLGHTYLRLARPDKASAHFQQVPATTSDPFLIYLTRFFAGRIHEAAGERAAAIAAYREALQSVPRAESASLALGRLLFTGDERDEAYDIVAASLSQGPVQDPWRQYPSGSFHLWQDLIARLRQELR